MPARHNPLLAASRLLLAAAMTVNAPLIGLAQGNSAQAKLRKPGPDPIVDVRDVDNPARKPIQFRLANINADDPTIFEVPLGARLVIEFVSATGQTNEFCVPLALSVNTTADGVRQNHSFAPTRTVVGIGQHTAFAASQPTRLYGDPGTTVTVSTVATFVQTGGDCVMTQSVSFSGYLVTLP